MEKTLDQLSRPTKVISPMPSHFTSEKHTTPNIGRTANSPKNARAGAASHKEGPARLQGGRRESVDPLGLAPGAASPLPSRIGAALATITETEGAWRPALLRGGAPDPERLRGIY
ncbi:MAG: hypothetical protein LBK95_18815 [Bifidobacteriaceae bacterium]|nr:hypothetical protein [Bifidobacteriaceae bacterium]